MPRTSYGDRKRNQAWKLLAALMKQQGNQGVQLCQDATGQTYLKVRASLLDMKNWSNVPIDGVREALTQHLGEKFLNIMTDQREQKAGRGAELWQFESDTPSEAGGLMSVTAPRAGELCWGAELS